MQFTLSTILSLLAIAPSALTTPTPAGSSSPSNSGAKLLAKRAGNTCSFVNNGGWDSYSVGIADDSFDDTCGGGILDNLRGRCGGGITAWACTYAGETAAVMTFNVPKTCSADDVENAIHAASGGQDLWLDCGDGN